MERFKKGAIRLVIALVCVLLFRLFLKDKKSKISYDMETVSTESFEQMRLNKGFWPISDSVLVEKENSTIYKLQISEDSIKYLTLSKYSNSSEFDILILSPNVHVYKSWEYYWGKMKYGIHIYQIKSNEDTIFHDIKINKKDYFKLIGQ
jgi:hypothetical protein